MNLQNIKLVIMTTLSLVEFMKKHVIKDETMEQSD